jgi:hypothetical protein
VTQSPVEAIAVGSLAFVDNVKSELGVKTMPREVAASKGTHAASLKIHEERRLGLAVSWHAPFDPILRSRMPLGENKTWDNRRWSLL